MKKQRMAEETKNKRSLHFYRNIKTGFIIVIYLRFIIENVHRRIYSRI